ncbi:flagellar hook-length control protein FliK [Silanimonas sp.]|jgi:flagellar hook-length control protein FliK|uniref:flagellar hook-length control protein FliK n=1 Tax=Silanimonas sp. TaxID=1929290 RepID=UPI0037C7D76E
MTLPSFSAALGAPSTTPMPALADGPLADGTGATIDAATGGFAAVLDEAAASLDALAASALEGAMPVLQALPEVPVPTLPAAAAIATALPTTLATTLSTLDASASPATPSDAGLDAAAPAPGWPPPGLSSLFPGSPVLAAQACAQAAASTLASARGFALSALLPEAVDSRLPDSASPSPATGLALDKGVASTVGAAAAMPMPLANAAGPDALAAALARQPATLRLPVADDSDTSALTALTETLGLERAPDAAPLAPTSPTPALHKLDLAQAFPAPVPLPSPRFAEEVGARLQWIAEQQGGEATLRISPDGLGPVEIRLKLDGDRVELGFTATQQDTRQALQDALPKLREMLAQQGLQLGQADVGQKHAQSSNEDAPKSANGFAGDDEGDAIVLAGTQRESNVIVGRVGRGVLDLYA